MGKIFDEDRLIEAVLERFSEFVDYDALAEKIAEELDLDEVVSKIDLEEVARKISVEDIAENIDLKELSEELPYTEEIEKLREHVGELEAKLSCVMEMLESLGPVISLLDKIKLVTKG